MSLVLYLGPMFSGKTTALIEHARKGDCTVIKFDADTRYASDKMMSHDQCWVTADFATNTIGGLPINTDIVVIDELQFYDNVVSDVMALVNDGKHVIASGLTTDYRQESFRNVTELAAHADDVKIMHGVCAECQQPSVYTMRTIVDNRRVLIGTDMYKPVCRKCVK